MNRISVLTGAANTLARRKPAAPPPLRFIDMFCGIGGFHCALTEIGCECVYACDIDEEARRAYAANFGIEPTGDITAIDPESIPPHDIFCAGFPCQPFSIIGKRDGFDDSRGTLFFEIARLLAAKKPQAFILENVRQLATHDGGRTLARIKEILESIGYAVDYCILDARNFGLPQKRERIIIVGIMGGLRGFAFPEKKAEMRPLAEILETEKDALKRHYVSAPIKKSRHTKHKAQIKPAIWHENKGGNVSSHPFSCALRAGASYNYLLVDGERRLTPREMLRLQGFPDSFRIVCNDSQTRKQAGNAVPVNVVRAVARQLKHALATKNKRQQARAS